MKALLIAALILSSIVAPAPGAAQSPQVSACPGRAAIALEVEHPTITLTQDGGGWARQTQMEIDSCVSEGTISPAYGYYLGLKVMARVIRYTCILNDETEKRYALNAFDQSVIEGRPILLSSTFASLVAKLQREVHEGCHS